MVRKSHWKSGDKYTGTGIIWTASGKYEWPIGLKNDREAPDSFQNQNRAVGPGTRIPTTGAVTTNVAHFLGNIAQGHNLDYGLVIYIDMKTFPPTNRIKNESAESSSHLDSANSNQKFGDILSFVKFNQDGGTDQIDMNTWFSSYNGKSFFNKNSTLHWY